MFCKNISSIVWENQVSDVEVYVPSSITGLQESLIGTLHVSNRGYVYSLSSKPVLWLKFLGLATYLTISSAAEKCRQIAYRCFNQHVSSAEKRLLEHTYSLASIARGAVICHDGMTLAESAEVFALNEIDYNNISRRQELSKPRSERFANGTYVAKCLQPLFYNSQARDPDELQEELNVLKSQSNCNKAQISSKEQQIEVSKRCHKYAVQAIINQQSCFSTGLRNLGAQETDEVECCNIMCYRSQKICGLLYKIDCCASRCWAIDCICCFCCFWPEGRTAVILT